MLPAHPNEPADIQVPRRRFRKQRLQLFIVFATAFVLLSVASYHEYIFKVSVELYKHHTQWRVLASLTIISGFLALLFGSRQWRFSLRTLLIATALIAVGLGLIVWLTPKPPVTPPLDVGDFPGDF